MGRMLCLGAVGVFCLSCPALLPHICIALHLTVVKLLGWHPQHTGLGFLKAFPLLTHCFFQSRLL